jgi:hypothetical protein
MESPWVTEMRFTWMSRDLNIPVATLKAMPRDEYKKYFEQYLRIQKVREMERRLSK